MYLTFLLSTGVLCLAFGSNSHHKFWGIMLCSTATTGFFRVFGGVVGHEFYLPTVTFGVTCTFTTVDYVDAVGPAGRGGCSISTQS